ncbi:hypothetical protein [Bradyrhizobium sp. Leo121]|uniref:hypothetical protein n=1 Tax=Bradyrhizobium sp. Leo121 TaxID=1571195 RepID=UPI001029E659|nr:hypothetical protein [Bradyrhizobium sp. Leo121]RZN32696.1 hypothetical protein CWO90_12520 [Bradyrhizobium sp. Leo121]
MFRTPLIILSALASMIASAVAQPASLTCSGSLFDPTGSAPSSKSVTLALGPPISIDTGNGPQRATVVSNNRIQLRFKTKDFTGEYFHYTSDLFLIYRSGHLARLTCQR